MTRILRQLSAIYLTAATAFVVMAMLAQHPDWAQVARQSATDTRAFVITAAVGLNTNVIQPGYKIAKEKSSAFAKWASNQISPPVQVAKKEEVPAREPVQTAKQKPAKPAPQIAQKAPPPAVLEDKSAKPAPVVVAKNEPPVVLDPPTLDTAKPAPPANNQQTIVAAVKPIFQLAPPPEADVRPTVSRAGPGPGELVRVAERLKSSLTSDLLNNFELFLYVSKANNGSWSQRMYVFAKEPGGNLNLLYNWAVSTGREKWELDVHGKKQNSFTPQGYYELDTQRMFTRYHSGQWNQPMPYAMFFNWEQNGYQTGLAIHAASGEDLALLGQRASAGCVRLAPDNARQLFNLIKGQYKGLAPKFAYDRRTATMDNNGLLLHDKNGKIVFDNGYKVLVFIENYGGNDMVAALF